MSDRAEAIRLYNEGLTRAKVGEEEEAKRLLESSLREDPGHVATYIVLGKLLAQQGDDEGAALLWEAALRLDPLDRTVRECLARLRTPSPISRVKRFMPGALFLMILPLLVWVVGTNLRVNREIQRFETHLSMLELSEAAPSVVTPRTGPDGSVEAASAPPESENAKALESPYASSISAEQIDILYHQALEDHLEGKQEIAILVFERILEYSGPHPLKDNAQYWIGESYLAQENYPAALNAFRRVETQFPESNKLLHAKTMAGWCMHQLGQDTDALEILTAALESSASLPESMKIRKKIYEISGTAP